jgi:hypothetical protein
MSDYTDIRQIEENTYKIILFNEWRNCTRKGPALSHLTLMTPPAYKTGFKSLQPGLVVQESLEKMCAGLQTPDWHARHCAM